MGRFPREGDGLQALVRQPSGAKGWNSPYLKKDQVPDDPWGNSYEYRVSGSTIEIISLGADGRVGGAGEDGDVSNDQVNTRSASGGFTLLELVVVLVIAGLLFSLGAPRVGKLYDSMQYREAVRELVSAAKNARRDAFATGQPMDLLIDTSGNRYALTHQSQKVDLEEFEPLPATLNISVVYAVEVSPRPGLAAIRFYPAGGSSGGEIKVIRPSGAGVQLTIDWLLGAVTQGANLMVLRVARSTTFARLCVGHVRTCLNSGCVRTVNAPLASAPRERSRGYFTTPGLLID